MITIEKMRSLIPNSDKLSDTEIQRIGQHLYSIVDAILDKWLEDYDKKNGDNTSPDSPYGPVVRSRKLDSKDKRH